MTQGENRITLRSHASELSSFGKWYTHLAHLHRVAASGLERRQKKVTYDRHFKQWIVALVELSAAAERLLALEVELAKSFGVTWDEVGAALGVSRQAAWERFTSQERQGKSRRASQVRAARTAVLNQETVLRNVREQVDGSATELMALRVWLQERPGRTQE